MSKRRKKVKKKNRKIVWIIESLLFIILISLLVLLKIFNPQEREKIEEKSEETVKPLVIQTQQRKLDLDQLHSSAGIVISLDGAARQYENIMQQSGFTVLKNENWYVTTDSDKKILFTGLDDSMLGNVYMPDSTKIYDSNYNILLIHEPDTADSFQEYPYDLVLSGHSHGGQVNIPFIPAINQKAISSTNLAKNYVSGMYELNSKTKIYVNTGIGTTHVSGRLGVVPEISIFHIYL